MEYRIEPKVGIVIVAGGKGNRMGSNTPKQFLFLGQAPILVQSINALSAAVRPAQIVVVLPEAHIDFWGNLSSRFEVAEHKVVTGGDERFDSVKAGIEALGEQIDIIAIHDAVRPLCSQELIARCVECAKQSGSAIPTVELSDSIRKVDGESSQAIDRSTLRAVQTPQVFDSALIRRAYRQAYSPTMTDDASVVEAMGQRVELCQGERSNIKITTTEDLLFAQMIWEQRETEEDGREDI